jgi:hypothetical protein
MPAGRQKGFNRAAVKGFFDILEADLQKDSYRPKRGFNVVETELSVIQSKTPRSYCAKRKKFGVVTPAELSPALLLLEHSSLR